MNIEFASMLLLFLTLLRWIQCTCAFCRHACVCRINPRTWDCRVMGYVQLHFDRHCQTTLQRTIIQTKTDLLKLYCKPNPSIFLWQRCTKCSGSFFFFSLPLFIHACHTNLEMEIVTTSRVVLRVSLESLALLHPFSPSQGFRENLLWSSITGKRLALTAAARCPRHRTTPVVSQHVLEHISL